MIIGLTGENCSGKGTIAEYLKQTGFVYYSLSDAIRDELKRDGKEVTRDNLIRKGNELRKKDPATLAKMIIEKINSDKPKCCIVDSIRNTYEAKELIKLKTFTLVYVTAPAQIRFERMLARAREADPKTLKDFLALENIERTNTDKKKQNIEETAKLANKTIVNDGNFSKLYDDVNHLLAELSGDFMVDRPSWDEYFMSIAKVVATRSNCIKRKVASVIVKDRRIISTGYNGTPRGILNCNEGGCERCKINTESGKNLTDCVCCHGEENAIVQASYHGIEIKNSSIYTTFSPCLLCTKMIINAGIGEVIYNAEYHLADISTKLLKEAGLVVRKFEM